MAKSKNHTFHNQNAKDHKNGIKPVLKRVDSKFRGMTAAEKKLRRRVSKLNKEYMLKAKKWALANNIKVTKNGIQGKLPKASEIASA